MKKIVFTLVLLLIGGLVSKAQISMNDVNKVSAIAGKTATSAFDVSGISSEILGSLKPQLKLTPEQVPQVTSIVTELLNKKKNALPMMAKDKAGYSKVMTGIQSAFPSKMKTVLKAQQYASLLGIMPKSASATNVLSKLLF
ncbi:hypothetical protein [Flavobacterium sp. TSSA_36]|uniref:hypothetical protein n=1 Tax=Flavobacterium sp. TSSA_36 TaxID=3447669 RepID=UPI003F39543A